MPTKLGTLINRMNRYQAVEKIDNTYKVQDLDEAIRTARRVCKFPWTLKAKNLKIFEGISLYNPESDFDGLAFLDDEGKYKTGKPEFQYTSIKQFYEDPNNRNLIAEIWNEGVLSLGVKYKDAGLTQLLLDECSDITKYTPSGDFTAIEEETVKTAIGSNSIKATLVEGTNIATLTCDIDEVIDPEYKKKYFFAYVYLASVPTSIDLKLKKDASNYLSKNILTQFDGRVLKANDWNILAFDLNDCVVEGSTGGEFESFEITLNGAEAGSYYFGETALKQWLNLNYQYYHKNLVKQTDGTYKEQFLDIETNDFDLLDILIGEDIFSDIILYEALILAINEQENGTIFGLVNQKREGAWQSLFEKYPDLQPTITTNYYNFIDDSDMGQDNSKVYV